MTDDFQFEVGLSVADYMDPDDSDPDCAFDLATNDEEGAIKAAQDELGEWLELEEIDQLTFTAEFQECDSGNWTHAGAMWLITIKGPAAIILRAQFHYENELGIGGEY